jgi:hypothetical protein
MDTFVTRIARRTLKDSARLIFIRLAPAAAQIR